ncbi:phasin family protein [Pseudomaricurvus sp. HS19]|uniref:phasin family protein n=1 Tax=Pseudomaricurvus sp. HS19 TaxID=2692626 RepID=UPI001369AC89|nr:phasin family protein [Pseudomaricurvus sp. HS19]MYM63628.1 hypothetical protein [Pseudomaricurvus sp. HS19]
MSELVAEAEEILETAETKAKMLSKKVTGAITKVGGAYKYAWFTCLGTAMTMEEKLTGLGKDVEGKLVDFSKKMADKGAKAKMASPSAMLVKKLDAPKAKLESKLESAKAEIKTKAQTKITDVEEVFDKGVNKSLHFIGVPSRKDMDQMTMLMKDMAESIAELSTQLADQKPAKSTAKKTTAKSADSQTSAA